MREGETRGDEEEGGCEGKMLQPVGEEEGGGRGMNTAGGPVRSEGGENGGWLVRGTKGGRSAVRLAFLNQRLQVNKVR